MFIDIINIDIPEEYLIFLYIYRVVIYIYYKTLCVWLWHESIEFNIALCYMVTLIKSLFHSKIENEKEKDRKKCFIFFC